VPPHLMGLANGLFTVMGRTLGFLVHDICPFLRCTRP
jgi:hypothetical protein